MPNHRSTSPRRSPDLTRSTTTPYGSKRSLDPPLSLNRPCVYASMMSHGHSASDGPLCTI
jgi:hypothetical protein